MPAIIDATLRALAIPPGPPLEAVPVSGGMSNLLYALQRTDERVPLALIRVFGSGADATVVRGDEAHVFGALAAAGLGPRLLAAWDGGRVEAFVSGRPLSTPIAPPGEKRDALLRSLLPKLREMHLLHAPGSPEGVLSLAASAPGAIESSVLVGALRKWLALVADSVDPATGLVSLPSFPLAISLDYLAGAVDAVVAAWAALDTPLFGLCHNDLHGGNVMETESGDLVLIDVEYAGYSLVGADLGNVVSEFMFDYSVPTMPGFAFTPDAFPDDAGLAFVASTYLGSAATPADVDALVAQIRLGVVSSDLSWLLWSLIQGSLSEIEYGYVQYALVRLDLYERHAALWLN